MPLRRETKWLKNIIRKHLLIVPAWHLKKMFLAKEGS